MRLFVLLILPIAAWCAPAQVTETEDESSKPLIRTKRADELIMYGDQQNKASIVKKAVPMEDLKGLDEIIDKKSDDSIKEVNKLEDDNTEDTPSETDEDLPSTEDASKEDELASSGEPANIESQKDIKNDYYNYNYYPYAQSYRYRRNTKAKSNDLLTAEHMEPRSEETALDSGARSKRDLTTEEIAQWLENGGGNVIEDTADYYNYDNPEYSQPPGWYNPALSQLLDEYTDVYQKESPVDYEDYNGFSEEPAANPKNKELLSLLEYLVASEAPKENDQLPQIYPEDVQEEWQDIEEEDEVTPYEPLVYNGVPGVFIPMESENVVTKRQYMSMVPGVRKRNDFYPYSLEPEGGRWGAFVDQVEEKRTADAYERLLRMAEALNPPSQRYYDDYKKK